MTAPTMTDIIPLPENLDELPPPAPFYYVQARNGPMVLKSTMFGKALVPVDEIPHLPDRMSVIWSDIPKLPAALVGQVWSFFAEVWRRQKTEAMVYLTYKDGVGYRVFVPDQRPTGGHVSVKDFDSRKLQRGWRIAGTMHSHCNFGAFHSGTDKGDAEKHDGLHLTLGYVDDPTKFQIAAMVSLNKAQWDYEPSRVIEGEVGWGTHPEWWHKHMLEREPGYQHNSWVGQSRSVIPSSNPGKAGGHISDNDYRGASGTLYGPNGKPIPVAGGPIVTKKDNDTIGAPDPYAASTPLHVIRELSPVDIVDILWKRGFRVEDLWGALGDGQDGDLLTEDDWLDEVIRLTNEIEMVETSLADYGISLHLEFGVDPTHLVRTEPQSIHHRRNKKKQKGSHL
jgi:hypothetical protein